jgi:Protein of unknown function (DUF3572)
MTRGSAKKGMDFETAEAIGLKALAFVAEDGARLGRFLSLTGLSPDQLRNEANASHTLQAVLEHLAEDESLLLVFAASAGCAPEQIEPARALLAAEAERRRRV